MTDSFFETPRLLLRLLVEADAKSVFEYAGDPLVSRYTSWKTHQSIADTITFINEAKSSYERGDLGPFAICLKTNPDQVIGTIRIKQTNQDFQGELSYSLSQKYWRQGLTLEAVELMLKLGFERRGYKRIYARCAVENEASQALVSKIGMIYEGCLRCSAFSKNRFWDVKFYSILSDEWQERQKKT